LWLRWPDRGGIWAGGSSCQWGVVLPRGTGSRGRVFVFIFRLRRRLFMTKGEKH